MLQRILRLRDYWAGAPTREQNEPARVLSGRVHPLLKMMLHYAGWWAAGVFVLMVCVTYIATPAPQPTLVAGPYEDAPPLANKLLYYRQHKSEFDLILLGDSLTYTGLHPEFLDPVLGTHSINIATFAHWFATQYPLIKDLAPEIPVGTRVLWSIHNWDFDDNLAVRRVYPVGFRDAVRYWAWGAHNSGLADNLLYYNPLTRFLVANDEIRGSLISFGSHSFGLATVKLADRLGHHFGAPGAQAPPTVLIKGSNPDTAEYAETVSFSPVHPRPIPDTPEFEAKLSAWFSRSAAVVRAVPKSDNGLINSVVVYFRGGGYYRIELLPEYFFGKQQENARLVWRPSDADAEAYTPPQVPPVSLRMFEAGLQAFKDAHIPVTVNMMEEAPYTFGNQILRRKTREFLDEKIRSIVESYGDDYVHADYSSMTDADYFDYNHFNSEGIAKYTPLLLAKLRETPAFRRAGEGHH